MSPYYQSNWNRNNRSKWRKILASVLYYPTLWWNNLRTQKSTRRQVGLVALYIFVGMILVGSAIFAFISFSLPDPNKLNARIVPQSTKIYARDGTTLLYEIHGEAKRTLVNLSDIPDYAKQATIAIEDKNFYNNPGVDLKGILRSVFVDVTSGSLSQGGSTITQQFVRNAILTREKTVTRKIKEIVLAIELEQKYSKDDILKLYLNEIPYGQNAYGIEAAAQTYFGKHARDLTLPEAAYLAALPQAPTYYNPSGPNREQLDNRKNLILDQMFEQGYISAQQRDDAKATKITFSKIRDAILAPHFVLYVQSLLAEKYGEQTLEEGGLTVVTTLDWKMQQAAEKAVADKIEDNIKRNKASNASLVAIDPKTGQILAMVGSRNYFDPDYDGQVNVALQPEQPGSSFKPYVYVTAFKQGMSPATMLMDVKTVFGSYQGKDYAPSNYDGADHGIVNIRKAMAGSLNVPAVKTLALVGVQNAIDTAKDMGIKSDISADKCGLALVLGGCEVTLLDHVSAMGTFANYGVHQEHTPILKVTSGSGDTLEEYEENPGQPVLDPQLAFQIISIMTDNDARSFVFGPNSPLILPNRTVAAKTGTSQNWRDGWTLGYTPSLVAGVWTGNNDGSLMRQGADGVVVAAPIWHNFMVEALKDTAPEEFQEPQGIQHVVVDAISGKLPTEFTLSTKTEVFANSNLPTQFDDVHVGVQINEKNGLLATDQTSSNNIVTKVFTVIHSEKPENPDWENPVVAWALANGFTYPPTELDNGTGSGGNNGDPFNKVVSFIAPSNHETVTTLPLSVQVEVSGFITTGVDLFLDGQLVGTKNNAPFSFNLGQASDGPAVLEARARVPGGGVVSEQIQIKFKVSP